MFDPENGRFKGLEVISLNVDRYFNQVRKPGLKASSAVQETYGFKDEAIEEEIDVFDLG